MAALNEDIVFWTLEGIDKGAQELLIVKDKVNKRYRPQWIMPGESIEATKERLSEDAEIEDGINLILAKDYFSKGHWGR